ncbi:hypothetical protein, partial [Lacrimispora sp.]|uniref:hypothetical protein n=1 Tax=Lacrimispora sp. TaxID=2719234 RepID=UPI00321639DB
CIRSEFSHSKPLKHGLFIRIFRVLHTVQSSVFKVLFSFAASGATHIGYHVRLFLSTIFFIFFKTFLIGHRCVFGRSLPPFSAARYIIPKLLTKVNMFFGIF